MIAAELEAQLLPASLRTPHSPVAAFVELRDGPAFVSSAGALVKFARTRSAW